jgi:predicted FMN-binding regulatory protein PaiB
MNLGRNPREDPTKSPPGNSPQKQTQQSPRTTQQPPRDILTRLLSEYWNIEISKYRNIGISKYRKNKEKKQKRKIPQGIAPKKTPRDVLLACKKELSYKSKITLDCLAGLLTRFA